VANRVITIFISAILLTLWSSFSWRVLPLYEQVLKDVPNEEQFVEQISRHINESGVYRFPGISHVDRISETSKINWLERARKGPFGYIFVRSEGVNPLEAGIYIRNFVINILASSLAFWVLTLANIKQFKKRWAVSLMFGGIVAVYGHLQMWNWMFFPIGFTLVNCIDTLVAWSLAGVPLAMGTANKPTNRY